MAFRSWPNPRANDDIWPLESASERETRLARRRQRASTDAAYQSAHTDECGRLALADKSIAVPFVGAVAGCVVLAEMLKALNGGPTFSEIRLRLSSLTSSQPGRLLCETAPLFVESTFKPSGVAIPIDVPLPDAAIEPS
ncbi:hypothetical protein MAFF211471_51630 (plasmid) [Ralstonia solanacearum]|nr:hypothetical protein MAFF211471_51630 [Ralstonia solanacearum]BCN02639.1 hypothetical protein RPSA_51750 [Ralstonia solanacearum]